MGRAEYDKRKLFKCKNAVTKWNRMKCEWQIAIATNIEMLIIAFTMRKVKITIIFALRLKDNSMRRKHYHY